MIPSPRHSAGEALAAARGRLSAVDRPGLDASILVAHALGVSRTAVVAHPEMPLGPAARARLEALVARRASGEPLGYLTGMREFWSLDLEVDSSTLVPRPETERLVEVVLAAVQEMDAGGESLRMADLGTGCGAVAIALAREAGRAQIVATDIDAAVLAVARRNIARLAPGRVALRLGSWCDPLEAGRYCVIASNPPYLRAADPHLLEDGVRCEPRRALVSGGEGFAAIRAITRGSGRCLRPGGRLVLEHGAEQGATVRRLLRAAGFAGVRTSRDLEGRERVTEGERP